MKDRSGEDVTVMRLDASMSKSISAGSGAGSGEADAPRVLKQRFVLEEKLGSGGMGTVFRAKDLRKVEARDRQPFLAVKVLNNDFREHPEAFVALQREAVKSQSVSHPNIVSIYDFDKDGDLPFITMELLEGEELAELIRAHPDGLPDEMAWEVIRGICAGLGSAHEAGIVHSDFKPGNVFVSPSNSPKILDFGIARAVQLTGTASEDTQFDPRRLAALTPAYASREMINGDNPQPRDDLYSLGIVIYLVLTGSHPFGRLSAVEAAKEELKPERPGRLSRRQWQAVRKCLAFNRQDRPEDVAEVEALLFSPSPWRSRPALAAALAFVCALGVSFLIENADLNGVKQEIRNTTLVNSQVARISALLDEPRFDESWESLLRQEVATLRGLEGAQSVATALSRRISAVYTSRIAEADELDEALDLLDRGAEFGELADAESAVSAEAFARVMLLLEDHEPSDGWFEKLTHELERLKTAFPGSTQIAELELELADVLDSRIQESVSRENPEQARLLLSELERVEFDLEVLEQNRERVATAEAEDVQASAARQANEVLLSATRDLEAELGKSCLHLNLAAISDIQARFADSQAAARGLQQIDQRLLVCMHLLAELERDRALALQVEIRTYFGQISAAATTVVDPCGLKYLVGNGAQSGRGGYCSDELDEGVSGPRLVVLPAAHGSGRYAMTKHEVTWADFNLFCLESDSCGLDPGGDRMPVTGVDFAIADAYASWLTRHTGFRYRLPTADEWQWAARGQPDPNRNCRVQLDGVERGLGPVAVTGGQVNEFGLVHMLGNVQEWVVDAERIRVVGGAYSDPIQDCVAQTSREHGGKADVSTGFRLVREIS